MTYPEGVKVIFVDPFDGRGRTDYNTDVGLVRAKISPYTRVTFIIGAVPECLVGLSQEELSAGEISFVHLNTGSIDSDIASLEWLHERLLPGAFVVWDTYGWCAEAKQKEVDNLLVSLRVSSLVLPTGQLVGMKSRYPRNLSDTVAQETKH